jgi:hypothetical protein
VKAGTWLAVGVGTLIWAIALWFGFLALSTARTVALVIIASGLVFGQYAIAGFSGAPDVTGTGFRASLIALGVGISMLAAYELTGTDAFAVASPVAAMGIGAAFALQPVDPVPRVLARIAVVAAASAVMVLVYGVDPTVYGLVAPLVSLPVLPPADHLYERGAEIVAASSEH